MAEIIKCPGCAAEISDDNETCMICGYRLNSAVPRSAVEDEPTIECLDVRRFDHPVRPHPLHDGNESAASPEAISKSVSGFEHHTAGGLFFIMFMSAIGTIVGLTIGFYGGLAVATVIGDNLAHVFSRGLYREAPIVSGYYFFATMLLICFYTGGSLGKYIYLSTKLSGRDHKAMYSKYVDRLIRTWGYALIGAIINIVLFLIVDINLLNPPRRDPDAGVILILLAHALIAGFTIFSIHLAKKHSA